MKETEQEKDSIKKQQSMHKFKAETTKNLKF